MKSSLSKFIEKKYLILISIAALAFALRIWNLGNVPPSPDWDEAALGYNAYSILQTGRDEYGKLLPLVLRSFDDYKPGLYAYFIIPFLPIFGLTIQAVRLPSVIFGTLTVVLSYFLVTEVFGYSREKKIISPSNIGLLTASILAISPWHIQFSRIAFESNMGVLFNVLAAVLFLKGLKRQWLLVFSAVTMSLNLYVYQSEKVFTPLLLLILIFLFKRELFDKSKKILMSAAVAGIIVALPMLTFTLTNKEGLARAKGVSVFSDQTQFLKNNAEKIIRDKNNNDTLGLVLDNRRVSYGKAVIAGYISHLDFNWLFITGDLPRHHAPFMGLLYIWELPFVLMGMYFLIFGPFPKKAKLLFLLWFLAVPIPASITSGVPHSIRTLNYLPIYPLLTALGIIFFAYKFREVRSGFIKYVAILSLVSFIGFNFVYYLNQYFVQQNYYVSQDWQYGYKDAITVIKPIESRYKKIIVSNKPHLDQSYMFFLFYLRYSPALYQKESQQASGGFRENHVFGKYEFRPIEWSREEKSEAVLYIGRPGDFPENAHVIKTINFLDGSPAIKIVEG